MWLAPDRVVDDPGPIAGRDETRHRDFGGDVGKVDQGGHLKFDRGGIFQVRRDLQDELAAISCVHVKIALPFARERPGSAVEIPMSRQDIGGVGNSDVREGMGKGRHGLLKSR